MFVNRPAINNSRPVYKEETQKKFSELKNDFKLIRDAVQKDMLAKDYEDRADLVKIKADIEESFNQVLEDKNILLNHAARVQMLEWVVADIIGLWSN